MGKKKKKEKLDLSKIISDEINTSNNILSKEQQEAFDLINDTHQNLFIQGQAGTGKSSFIMYLKEHLKKSIVVCSPTAIAAINVGGQTLHSFFKLPISDFIDDKMIFKANRKKVAEVILKTEILVIDEISMVRPDMLDAINTICKQIKHNKSKPFGGIQVVLIGDIYQLPPVITKSAQNVFKNEYGTSEPYFFDAYVYHEADFKKIEFTHVYRQQSIDLLNNLSKLRINQEIKNVLEYFNRCKITDEETLKTCVTITPYREIADKINQDKLNNLSGKEVCYKAMCDGSFIKAKSFPAAEKLRLKVGALVIFNKNNAPEWINGSSGIVTNLENDFITVKLLSNGKTVFVERTEWKNREYCIKTERVYDKELDIWCEEKVIKEITTGTFTQFPLQLGYSMTIHKAQGKTLDKVIIDIGRGAFAHGQLYVALSRTRNYEDMHIINPLQSADSIVSKRVVEFMSN